MPGHECKSKSITSLLGRMNGLGDVTSAGAQRAASDAKKEGKGFSRTFHAYRTQRSDRNDLRNLQQPGATIVMIRKKCGPAHAGG